MRRLRGPYSSRRLAEVYDRAYDHSRWPDHIQRVEYTIGLAERIIDRDPFVSTVADLSCGDGAVAAGAAKRLLQLHRLPRVFLGDLRDDAGRLLLDPDDDRRLPFVWQYSGPIEATLELLAEVDLFICTETLEHVDDPAGLLAAIRPRTRWLLLTCPVTDGKDDNPEHYWSFGVEDVRGLLEAAGFTVTDHELLDLRYVPGSYEFQMWVAK